MPRFPVFFNLLLPSQFSTSIQTLLQTIFKMLTSLATPFLFLGSLALNPFSTARMAQSRIPCADVFIVGAELPGTTVVRNALNILDVVDVGGHVEANARVKTYSQLSPDFRYGEVVGRCPDAKFIVPYSVYELASISRESTGYTRNSTHLQAQAEAYGSMVLDVEVGGNERYAGETWERLCRFMGLGYSMLERKGLRKFPGEMGGREEVRRGLGGRFGYGYAGFGGGTSV
ncbi:hypothetical protein BJ878DRAFT_524649 [Calycina marina]|uniref:Uncharacterized protein n=1 Tax=Calycina marina TaxID=1763456 RepID=A0A9P7YVW2_9HELO|nr:hypothetical protein BJ878DRAFT_524649 [Calycina marina]